MADESAQQADISRSMQLEELRAENASGNVSPEQGADGGEGEQLLLLGDGNDDDAELDRPRSAADLDSVYDIPVQLQAVLGRATMEVDGLLKLGLNSVVEIDRKVGEAIDIYINNRLVARGEVVTVNEKLGVTMTEIIKMERQ